MRYFRLSFHVHLRKRDYVTTYRGKWVIKKVCSNQKANIFKLRTKLSFHDTAVMVTVIYTSVQKKSFYISKATNSSIFSEAASNQQLHYFNYLP
jgi:hypothetical protein